MRTAVAIGNFDGIHLGHQKILARLRSRARSWRAHSLVLTFYPHPERVLGKEETLLIQTLEQRIESLREEGVDTVVVTSFGEKFSELAPRDFVESVLKDRLAARGIVVGQNFRFGNKRTGDTGFLRRLGSEFAMSVDIVPPQACGTRTVSSSAIRRFLVKGQVDEAARFLGRPYEIKGKVVRGRSRGQSLGFPTANLQTANEILPDGVFITRTLVGGTPVPSLTSIGTNPTFRDGSLSVETHLLAFRASLYRQNLTVLFYQKIRNTRTFRDSRALSAQMEKDRAEARAYFDRETREG